MSSTIDKLIERIKNPRKMILSMCFRGMLPFVSDEMYIRMKFRDVMGDRLDLSNPKTFNEKIQWLKLHDRNPEYVKMVDKYHVKKYVAKKIGKEYIIPTLGVWNSFDEIDFDKLPDQFVLKCTHDSGGLVICKDKSKLDIESARKRLNKSLNTDYFMVGREWPYKKVRRRIIAEKYMEDSQIKQLRDYKFFCFDGHVRCYKIDFDRFVYHRANYFDADGNLMKLGEVVCPPKFDEELQQPRNKELMMQLAEKLSEGIPFVRVDFYEVDEKVYFGELTFYPNSGFGKFVYKENDELLGSWLKLPE